MTAVRYQDSRAASHTIEVEYDDERMLRNAQTAPADTPYPRGCVLLAPDGRIARNRDDRPIVFRDEAKAWGYLEEHGAEIEFHRLPSPDNWVIVHLPATAEGVAAGIAAVQERVTAPERRAVEQSRERDALAAKRRRYVAGRAAAAYRRGGLDAAHEVIAISGVDEYRAAVMAIDLIWDPDRGHGVSPLSATQYGHGGWRWREYLTDAERRFGRVTDSEETP